MSDPTPATGLPSPTPDPTPATGTPQAQRGEKPAKPDQAATLPMNLNSGAGQPKEPLADATIAADLNVKHPPAADAATLPTAKVKDAQDLQATVPSKGWDEARTQLSAAPAPGSQPSSDQTLPANLNIRQPTPTGTALSDSSASPKTGTSATAATLPLDRARTLPTSTPSDAATLATGQVPAPPGTGSFARTSLTQRIARTKLNASLPPESQQLDTKLQMSRPSVLADMAATRGGVLPKGVQKLIDEQGTEGRYAINKELAHGGMGAVLDIADHDFRRRAAMKVILARFAESPEAMERFLAEAQVTAQLEHPNIVPIHDLGVMDDGTLYFTMKMIEGQSLGKVVKLLQQERGLLKAKDGGHVAPDAESRAAAARWTETEKLHVFLKVLDGVGFANSRGVIHRDLKPDNIMLGGHGEVLVVDWGIAKVLGDPEKPASGTREVGTAVVSIRGEDAISATMVGSAMGTIYYMPPEQALGEIDLIDARSDVYALGATLYELLSLKRCISGTNVAEMIVKISHGEITPLDQADPTLHPDLVAIVHKAMGRTPESRYADCAAFSADLRRYLAGAAVEARRRSIGELIRQWVEQNRLRLQLGVAGVVLVAGAIVATSWWVRKADRDQGAEQFAKAKAQFAALSPDATVEDYAPIQSLIDRASEKLPQDRDIDALKKAVANAAGQAEMRAKELERKKVSAEQAKQLAEEGRADEAKGDAAALADAEKAYASALKLAPDEDQIQQALVSVRQKLKDSRRVALEAELKKHLAASRDALAEAGRLPPLDAKTAALVKTAQAELVLADADPDVKVAGVAEMAKQAEIQRAVIARAQKEADDLARAKELAGKAKAALGAGKPDEALPLAQQAMGFAPADAEVTTTYAAVAAAKATLDAQRAEQARRKNAEDTAAKLLADARKAQDEMNQQRELMLKSRREAERLEHELADKSLSDKKPVFLAVQSEREARRALVQAWARCEGLSQQVAVTLEPWAAQGDQSPQGCPQAYRDALSILAQLYHNRLLEAKATRNLPEIEAFRNLLARADRLDHAYAAELANQATVRIDGQPTGAQIMARPVQEGSDTRLVAVGDPRPVDVGKPLQLDAGAWQFTAGDTTITWVLRPDRPTAIAWPKELRRIPNLPLRYVPADLHLDPVTGQPAGMKPFLLGVTEVTVGQYLVFLKDPGIFAQVRKGFKNAMAAAKAAGDGANPADLPKVPFVPYKPNGVPDYVELRGNRDGDDLADIVALGGTSDLPVARLSRDDAEAFCQWLSQKNGCKARLPLKAEWQFAANGDDVQRVYPWGPHFDANFAVCSGVQILQGQAPVRQVATDVGPFGHLGLAGNVREWLGDRGTKSDARAAGAYHGLIAGGAWSDDDEHWFRTSYIESIDPSTEHYPAIGFRVLVEVQ